MSAKDDLFEAAEKILMSKSKISGDARVNDFVKARAAYEMRGKKMPESKYKEMCKRMYIKDISELDHTDDEINKIFDGVKAITKIIMDEDKINRELRASELPDYLYHNEKGDLCIEMKKYARYLQKTLNILYYPTADQLFVYNNIEHCYRSENIGNEIDKMILSLLEERDMDSSHLRYYSDEITKHLKSMEGANVYPFNNSKDSIPVNNGVLKFNYDEGTVELLPHGPEHHFNYVMGADWVDDVNGDIARNLIRTWVSEENINDIIQIAAQSLVQKQLSQQMKRATLMVGLPNTGKTKCKKLITSTLGPQYVSSVSLQEIAQNQFATGSLEKATINFVDDMDSIALNTVSKFKDLTGDTQHDIERKGIQPYPGKITCGWAFTCNFPPSVVEKVKRDAAFWKRWNVVYFENVFQDVNSKFEENTFTAELRSSFLRCIVEMMIDIHRKGRLVSEHSVDDVMTKWLSKCDSVTDFIDSDIFTPVEKGGEPVYYIKEKVFDVYQRLSVKSGFSPDQILTSKNAFYTSMHNHGFLQIRKQIMVDGERCSIECFKTWMRPAGEIKSDGNYYVKRESGDHYGEINEIGMCLFDYTKTDTSLIAGASNKTVGQ